MEILFKIKSPADFTTTFSNFSKVGNILLKKVGNMSEQDKYTMDPGESNLSRQSEQDKYKMGPG